MFPSISQLNYLKFAKNIHAEKAGESVFPSNGFTVKRIKKPVHNDVTRCFAVKLVYGIDLRHFKVIFALNRTTFKLTFANKVCYPKWVSLQMINIAQVVIVLMCQLIATYQAIIRQQRCYQNIAMMMQMHVNARRQWGRPLV